MFDWERNCLNELPDHYWRYSHDHAIYALPMGQVIVYYDWTQFAPREGLVIIGRPYAGPDREWTPNSPAHFWRDLKEAEKYVQTQARAQNSR